MTRVSLSVLFLLLLRLSLFSQRVIEVSYTQDSKGNLVFTCNNRAFCTYVLSVNFTTFQNAKADHTLPYEGEVKPGMNRLFTVSQEGAGDLQIKYTSSYQKGCLHPSINPAFTYILPIAPGKETQVFEMNKTPGTDGQDSGLIVRLKMQPGDTIYAARRGVVTAVRTNSAENDAGAAATDNWNAVEIVHGDCTFGQYGVFKKDGAFVHPGQTVEAGTPLGLVGGDKFGRGSDVRFNVSYYQGPRSIPLPMQFWTKKNGKGKLKHGATYISEHPKAILSQEAPAPPATKKKVTPPAKKKS
jgi:murein DD-endopeptidase MepM/ murein hydrolase activator NlpD